MEKEYQAKNSPPVSPRPSATAERRNTTGSTDENDFRGVESSSSPRVQLSSRSSSGGGGGGSRRRFSGDEDQALSSPRARGALMSSQLSAGGGNGVEGGGKLRPRSSANKLTPRRASEKGSGGSGAPEEGERSAVPRRYTFNDFDDTDDNTEPGSEASSRRESRRSLASVDDSNFEEDAW